MTPEVKVIVYVIHVILVILNAATSGMCYYSLHKIWNRDQKFDHVLHVLAIFNILCVILNSIRIIELC